MVKLLDKKMAKKFVIILIATLTQMYLFEPQSFAQSSKSNQQQMKTLEEYEQSNPNLDISQMLYVFDRCVAVLIYAASSSSNSKNAVSEQFSNNARMAYVQLSMRQAMLIAKNYKDKEKEIEYHQKLIPTLVDFYTKRSDSLYANGQSIDNDAFIAGDMTYCVLMKKAFDEMDKK
jgi:hypothetical protein